MSNAHTPGPWSCAQIWRGPETKVHAEVEGRRIALAEIYTMYEASEKGANARLIAAAPELLEALKGLLAECDRHGCFENVSFEFPSVKPFFDAARSAVAKAEGQS